MRRAPPLDLSKWEAYAGALDAEPSTMSRSKGQAINCLFPIFAKKILIFSWKEKQVLNLCLPLSYGMSNLWRPKPKGENVQQHPAEIEVKSHLFSLGKNQTFWF